MEGNICIRVESEDLWLLSGRQCFNVGVNISKQFVVEYLVDPSRVKQVVTALFGNSSRAFIIRFLIIAIIRVSPRPRDNFFVVEAIQDME